MSLLRLQGGYSTKNSGLKCFEMGQNGLPNFYIY